MFQMLEEKIFTFVKNELKTMKKVLSPGNLSLKCLNDAEKVFHGEDDEHWRRRRREEFLNITLHFLRKMKLEMLVEQQNSKRIILKFDC